MRALNPPSAEAFRVLVVALAIAACSQPGRSPDGPAPPAAPGPAAVSDLPAGSPDSTLGTGPEKRRIAELPPPAPPPGETTTISVPSIVREPAVSYETGEQPPGFEDIRPSEVPVPRKLRPRPRGRVAGAPVEGEPARSRVPPHGPSTGPAAGMPPGRAVSPPLPAAPPFLSTFDTSDFNTNAAETGGFVFIPPDSHGAAGPGHVVNVVNVTLRFHEKDGTLDFSDALRDFFAPEAPATFTFDPKVLYDQFAGRFVVVTLERQDNCPLIGDPIDDSRIFLAVSDDADPNGTWYTTTIPSVVTITGQPRWADYPGFAVDEEAIYVNANMFTFGTGAFCSSSFGGVRLWVIAKGLGSGGFYDGGAAVVSGPLNPYGGAGNATTTQPAHVYGTAPTTPNVGTWLVSYSGLTGGGNEFVQVVRINNPLGSPTFTQQFINVGNIEDFSPALLPDAPQSGTATLIETNDRRALDAVWRDDNSLWMTATIEPNAPSPNANQSTAHFWQLNTTNLAAITLTQQGDVGGEDIAAGSHTFFPSIAVNSANDVAIGFSASASSIFASSAYTTRAAGDAAGSTSGSVLLRPGLAFYVRTFGSGSNRWGDYSGAALDPANECFWIYNEHAIARGTPIGGEDGRWGTAFGLSCPCSESFNLTTGQWKQIALTCNPGAANTVADVFANDLSGTYGTNWIVYERDAANDQYVTLGLTDPLAVGEGYWIKTNQAAQSVANEGRRNVPVQVPLATDAAGRFNLVGHPFGFDVCWADAQVIDGASTLTLAQADPGGACQGPDPLANGCLMSRIANKWTGSAYAPFDGQTPTAEGTLVPWDGFWVRAFKAGIQLRIPATAGNCGPPESAGPGWHVRLIAEADGMRDAANVLGQLPQSLVGFDAHDLPELAPFAAPYLTVLFPHPEWGQQAGDYATDFRPLAGAQPDRWRFDVATSETGATVTLSWQGPTQWLRRSVLKDLESGQVVPARPDGRYIFTAAAPRHRFAWILRGSSPPASR